MVISAAHPASQEITEGHGGCGLRDLCPQDKRKVAKLIRQVVDLQQEAEVQRSRSKGHEDQTEQLKHLREKNKEIVQENTGLRSKLAHALALLRMYQHRVQLLDAAASHQEAARPSANNTGQPVQGSAQPAEAQSTGYENAQAARDGHAHATEAPGTFVGVVGIPAACLRQPGQTANDSSGGCVDKLSHQDAHQQQLGAPEVHRDSMSSHASQQPDSETKLPGAQGCRESHDGKTQAEATADESAGRQTAARKLHLSSEASSGQTSALTQARMLRFDPTVGNCGAFLIVVGDESSAASQATSDSGADAVSAQREGQSAQSEGLVAGRGARLSHDSTEERAEMPCQALPQPGPQTASRPDTGRTSQQSVGKDAQILLSPRGSSPRQTERSSGSSAGMSSRQFGGSLMDLVAEVEQLIGQGDGSCNGWSHCSAGGSQGHSDVTPEVPESYEAASALQDGYCQKWIGDLVNGHGNGNGRPNESRLITRLTKNPKIC